MDYGSVSAERRSAEQWAMRVHAGSAPEGPRGSMCRMSRPARALMCWSALNRRHQASLVRRRPGGGYRGRWPARQCHPATTAACRPHLKVRCELFREIAWRVILAGHRVAREAPADTHAPPKAVALGRVVCDWGGRR
eukprot:scaffold296899_cov21-Tisochrysis_lutea.AAC.1